MPEPLAALALLERQYDGPIAPELRLAARLGSAEAALRARALGEAHFFTTLAKGQIRTLRRLRAARGREDAALATLRLYLGERRRFRRMAC